MTDDPREKGVKFIFGPFPEREQTKHVPITIRLTQVPLIEAIRCTAALADLQYTVEPFDVYLTAIPKKGILFTETFHLPPNSFDSGIPNDKSITDWLKEMGIHFPEGSSAVLDLDRMELIVRQNHDGMELVDAALHDIYANAPPGWDGELESRTIRKMERIIIPEIDFFNVRFADALAFLRERSVELDTKSDKDNRGVKIALIAKDERVKDRPITLKLTNVPLSEALRYSSSLAGCQYRVVRDKAVVSPEDE